MMISKGMMFLRNRLDSREKKGQSFLHGAIVLTAGMAIVKIVGALFKVPLSSVIGEYGMGLFSVAYNFYGPIHSLATAGLPIAIARMISESESQGRYRDIRQIKRVSTPIFILLGVLGMSIMFLFAPYYCEKVLGNPNAVLPMLALAPAVLFGCLGSVYRGYFEGLRDMYPTAVSEVLEAVSKLVFGLGAAVWAAQHAQAEYTAIGTVFGITPTGADQANFLALTFAATGAILGVTCGSLFSFLFLWLRYRLYQKKKGREEVYDAPRPRSRKTIAKRLIATAIPVAIGSVTVNVASLIDTTFLQSRLTQIMQTQPQRMLDGLAGMIPQEYLRQPYTIPNFLYGCYTMALTVYMLVPTLTHALSISALPNITKLWTSGDKKALQEGIESVLRAAAFLGLPAGIGISAISPYITGFLYGTGSSRQIVSGLLTILGFAAAAAAISTPLSSMLQAVGRADLPVKMLLGAMALKIAVNYILCGIPEIGVYGAGIGTLLCYLFLAIGELWLLCRVTGIKPDWKNVIGKPLLAAVLCGAGAYAAANLVWAEVLLLGRVGILLATGAGILAGGLIYLISLAILRGIRGNGLVILSKRQKVTKILEKHR